MLGLSLPPGVMGGWGWSAVHAVANAAKTIAVELRLFKPIAGTALLDVRRTKPAKAGIGL